MTGLLSIIIPSADPRFLPRMVPDLLAKAAGPVEIIISADGVNVDLPADPRVKIIRHLRVGMRGALNIARAHVRGDWVMKTDEHCLFAEGFDETLKAECADNWLLIPRRYSLDAENWAIEDNPKGPRDYHYLSCPIWSIRERDDYSMHGLEWPERTRARLEGHDLDETMSWQGSCYFMARRHYEWLGPMQEHGYGSFAGEPQELGNKTWLGGGAIMVTKRTWYAHLHKGKKYGRGYRPDKATISTGHEWGAHYWMTNRWPDRTRNLEWLVERFWPVPGWPDNWQALTPPVSSLEQLKALAKGALYA